MTYIRIFCLSILFLLPPVVEAQDDAYLPLSDSKLQVRHTTGFILAYSERHEQASWVAYELTAGEVAGGGRPYGQLPFRRKHHNRVCLII